MSKIEPELVHASVLSTVLSLWFQSEVSWASTISSCPETMKDSLLTVAVSSHCVPVGSEGVLECSWGLEKGLCILAITCSSRLICTQSPTGALLPWEHTLSATFCFSPSPPTPAPTHAPLHVWRNDRVSSFPHLLPAPTHAPLHEWRNDWGSFL